MNSMNSFDVQAKLVSNLEIKTIFDVGANIGDTILVYNRLFPQATIYGFEPFPTVFSELKNKFNQKKNIKTVPYALSNVVGTQDFYINEASMTNSFFPVTEEVDSWVGPGLIGNISKTEIPTITLDKFCQEHSINEIDILKMDIQGSELLALQGAVEKLKACAIKLIYAEVNFVSIYKNQAYFFEVCNFLAQYGYRIFDFYNFERAPNGQIKWGDAIFLNPDF